MRKYYIFVGILGIFIVTILTVGFVAVTNPFLEKAKKADEKRENDLDNLKYAINNYYQSNGALPEELPFETDYPSSEISFTDPESGAPYEYNVISPAEYELCAVFETDTTIKPETGSLAKNPVPIRPSGSTISAREHPKGRFCINNVMAGYVNPKFTPAPFDNPTPEPDQTNPTPTPDAQGWIFCSNEYQYCQFSGTKTVRYGANGQYVTKTITGGTACSNEVFGDPIEGPTKQCYYQNSTSSTVNRTPTPQATIIKVP